MSSNPLSFAPIISAAVWFAVSGYLIVHQQYRTWTERFFLALCLCAGSYATNDVAFFVFGQSNDRVARIAASGSLASITLMGLFMLLYGLSLAYRFRRFYLVAVVPAVFFLFTFPTVMFTDFLTPSVNGSSNALLEPVYNQSWLIPWLTFVAALWLIGIAGVTKTYLDLRKQNRKLANRIAAILAALALAVVAGAATNALVAVFGVSTPPLFSTFLAIPGVFIVFAVTPRSVRSLNLAVLRRRASEFQVRGAFLSYSDGTVIGARTPPDQEMIDADSFSATLDVIANFMRTSFPTLRGKWLKSIRHGDYTLILERGQFAFLTLVIEGAESDQLRRTMIEYLEDFELANEPRLQSWRGIAADATGVDRMLNSLLAAAGGRRNHA